MTLTMVNSNIYNIENGLMLSKRFNKDKFFESMKIFGFSLSNINMIKRKLSKTKLG